MKSGRFYEIWRISSQIKRHSLPTALHKTEEFLLSYLIYKVFRWISRNLPDFERLIARNGNVYVSLTLCPGEVFRYGVYHNCVYIKWCQLYSQSHLITTPLIHSFAKRKMFAYLWFELSRADYSGPWIDPLGNVV